MSNFLDQYDVTQKPLVSKAVSGVNGGSFISTQNRVQTAGS